MAAPAGGARCKPAFRRPTFDVADVFAAHGAAYQEQHPLTSEQRRVMRDLVACRTAALGGHLELCQHCGDETPSYNSCRNRHCPRCQGLSQARWIAERKARVLPVAHAHVVFTLPRALRPLASRNRKVVYDLLFRAAADTLLTFGADPRWLGAQIGVTAVLHTWTRELRFHPHLHCLVTAGGLSADGARWLAPRAKGTFLFPVRALGEVFRARFLAALECAYRQGGLRLEGTCVALADPKVFSKFVGRLYGPRWHVYSKTPFGGAAQVFEYLGRYTHRVGISNQRLVRFDERGVCFRTRGDSTTLLTGPEFIRRFLQHVLPTGFVKIRHYALYASGHVAGRLQMARVLLPPATPTPEVPAADAPDTGRSPAWADHLRELTGLDITRCPRCGEHARIRVPLPRALPCLPRPPPIGAEPS